MFLVYNGWAENQPMEVGNRVGVGDFANNTAHQFPEDPYATQASAIGDIDGDGDQDW